MPFYVQGISAGVCLWSEAIRINPLNLWLLRHICNKFSICELKLDEIENWSCQSPLESALVDSNYICLAIIINLPFVCIFVTCTRTPLTTAYFTNIKILWKLNFVGIIYLMDFIRLLMVKAVINRNRYVWERQDAPLSHSYRILLKQSLSFLDLIQSLFTLVFLVLDETTFHIRESSWNSNFVLLQHDFLVRIYIYIYISIYIYLFIYLFVELKSNALICHVRVNILVS
jgi:hypothetical protein